MNQPIHSCLALVLIAMGTLLSPLPADAAEQSDNQSRPAQAADAQAGEDATDTAASTTTKSAGAAPNSDQKQDGGQDKGFIPSEEISEDFAVSFPVDI